MGEWTVGDRVHLKSGSPVLTVVETGYDNNFVKCMWFAGTETKEALIPGGALERFYTPADWLPVTSRVGTAAAIDQPAARQWPTLHSGIAP